MIQWMDNFGSYGSTIAYMLNGLYAQAGNGASLVADPDPSGDGEVVLECAAAGANTTTVCRKVMTTPSSTVGVALRLWMSALPSSADMSPHPIIFCNDSNQVLVAVFITTTGAIDVLLNGVTTGSTILASSAGPVLVANAWQHIEMKVLFDATVGTVEVRVDGVAVIDEDSLDTIGAVTGPCAQIRQDDDKTASGSGVGWYIKDYIIWDSTGDHNNDFMGSCSVIRLAPDGDVTLGGWLPSSGSTGFDLIDESPPVDTGYVSADDAPPAAAEFSLEDLPPDVTSVRGLMMLGRMMKTDGGDAQVQMSMVSNGMEDNGADRPITPAFTYWYDISEEDPNTGDQWTPPAVDAASLKLNRTV